MKITSTLVATATLFAASTAAVTPAIAGHADNKGANAELQQLCTDLIASGDFPGLNRGECMSFNLTPDAGWRAHVCDLYRETTGFGEGEDFASYSDCVRNIY
jgi:hypothetical protein